MVTLSAMVPNKKLEEAAVHCSLSEAGKLTKYTFAQITTKPYW